MQQVEPFFREAGTGLGVVCIHSNGLALRSEDR
jgi:hypothetical protein